MHPSPLEQDRLLPSCAAELARRRRARGLLLDLPEAPAIVTDSVLEGARDGVRVAELMQSGRTVLARYDVVDGVPELLEEVRVVSHDRPVATVADAVRLPLPGGWTATAWGAERHRVTGALATLTAPEQGTA